MGVVVVVDADAALRKSLRLSLEGTGFTVAEAGSPDSALELIAQGRTVLVVTGLDPTDWQGLTLIKRIRRGRHPDLSVIAIATGTAKAPVEPLAALAETWGAAILYRPFDNRTLVKLARRLAPGAMGLAAIRPAADLEVGAAPLPVPRPGPRARLPSGRPRQ